MFDQLYYFGTMDVDICVYIIGETLQNLTLSKPRIIFNRNGGSRSNDNGWAQACRDVNLSACGDPEPYSRGRDKQITQWFLGSNFILRDLTKQPWALALVDYLGTFTNCIRKILLTLKLSTYSKHVRFRTNCHMYDENLAGNQILDRWNTGLNLLIHFLTRI
jgi:hypothetical protein